jgi:hypothetical protein
MAGSLSRLFVARLSQARADQARYDRTALDLPKEPLEQPPAVWLDSARAARLAIA